MNDSFPGITVVVVARNAASTITACMRSLLHQDYENRHVVLVDDGSTDDTVILAQAACSGLRVISSPTRSISANRNIGWRAAKTDFVAFLDADCEAPEGWLSALVTAAETSGASAVGGGNVAPSDEGRHFAALGIMLQTFLGSRGSIQGRVPETGAYVPHLPTLNVMYRIEALELAGGFDTRFARMGEDEDLSRRLGDMGLRLYATPDATVVHRQRSDAWSWARNMYRYGQGRTWLIRRHPNAWSPIFLIPPLTIPLLLAYLPLIALYALYACAAAKRIGLWPQVFLLFLATHIPYGIGQIAGIHQRGDNPVAQVRRKRVAMIALKNAGNKGDEAIVRCVSDRVTGRVGETDAAVDTYLAAFGPSGFDIRPLPPSETARDRIILDALGADVSARLIQPAALLSDALRCLLVFARFDFIFISGGQWLHDMSRLRHCAICSLFAIGRLFRTGTGVFCIGVGPLEGAISRWFVRRGFGPRSLMITRDEASTEILKSCGLAQARTAADPALDLPISTLADEDGLVLISPCAWASFANIYAQDQNQIEESFRNWLALAEGLGTRGYRLAMLPTMNPEDRAFAERISDATGAATCIDTTFLTPPQIQGHIAAASALISMRLHPVIFASNCNTPFVALNYADKVRAFCRQASMSDRVVELSSANWAGEVLRKLEKLMAVPSCEKTAAAREAQMKALGYAYNDLFAWLGIR